MITATGAALRGRPVMGGFRGDVQALLPKRAVSA